MKKFTAEAMRNGKRYAGVFEAEDLQSAKRKLCEQGFQVLLCREQEDATELKKEHKAKEAPVARKEAPTQQISASGPGTKIKTAKAKVTWREIAFGIGLVGFAIAAFIGYERFYGSSGDEAYQVSGDFTNADADTIIAAWEGQKYSITNMLKLRKEFGRNVFTPKTSKQYSYIYFKAPHVTFKINKKTNVIERVLPGEH